MYFNCPALNLYSILKNYCKFYFTLFNVKVFVIVALSRHRYSKIGNIPWKICI